MRDWCSSCRFETYDSAEEPCYNCVSSYGEKTSEFTTKIPTESITNADRIRTFSDYENTSKALRCCRLTSERGCAECPYCINNNEKCAHLLPDAADAIEELLAAVPHWISVEERLPEKKVGDEGYVGYLVLSDGEYQIADFTHDKYMQTAYEFHVDGEYDSNVTHWMELPPKEVE